MPVIRQQRLPGHRPGGLHGVCGRDARMRVPAEVLSDNGKQFTGRFGKPRPAEVLFERICRENGIAQWLTKPRSPTTTGKIERLHQTLQLELLNTHEPAPLR